MDWSELGNWNEYTRIFIGLFALVSPPIVIPLYGGIVAGRPLRERRLVALWGSIGFGITMWAFLFFGNSILDLFGISQPVFRIAGGFLLFLIALDMMRANPFEDTDAGESQASSAMAAGIVPLAIPILAGPGAMSSVVIFGTDHSGLSHQILVALVILALVIYLLTLLLIIAQGQKFIGKNATLIFNKIMGLIICAIAFEFILDGIAGHFPNLTTLH